MRVIFEKQIHFGMFQLEIRKSIYIYPQFSHGLNTQFMLPKVCTIMPNYFETSHLILLITQQFLLALITRLWEKLQEGLLLYACSQAYSFLRNTEHSSMKGVSGKKNPTLQQNHKKPCHILLIWVMVQCGIGSLHGNIYIYI